MTYDQIREQVADNSGVMTVSMAVLRDAHKAGKLGVNVRANIARALRQRGMGHVPEELPAYQHEEVRLWLMGTPAGDLIESVLTVSEGTDNAIRSVVESDAAAVVQRVRELVCE